MSPGKFISTRVMAFGIRMTLLLMLAATGSPGLWAQNAVPLINQPLAPESATPGSAGFTLTVRGAGFVATSVVQWNGSPRATTFVSGSKLTAAITAADVTAATTASVTVLSPAPGGGKSNSVSFDVTVPPLSLAFLLSTFNSSHDFGVTTGDFNGDGKMDFAVTSFDSPGSVCVYLGNGDGTFQSPVNYAVGNRPSATLAVDVNGDGKLDLVVTNGGDDTVSVLLGNGNGTFQPQASYATGGLGPNSIVAGDFNADGKLDLAVSNGDDFNGAVSVLFGNGDGTFGSPHNFGFNSGSSPSGIVAGDFNGDGAVDLAYANGSFSNGLAVLLNDGHGNFNTTAFFEAGEIPLGLVTADFNGDGKLDIAAADSFTGVISVALGNGDGTFQAALSYGSLSGATSIAAADINGDGKLDLVAGSETSAQLVILPGNGDGTFGAQTTVPIDSFSNYLAVADFNGDGKADIVTPGPTITVLVQTPITVAPTVLAFGSQVVGTTSAAQTVTVTNVGGTAVAISGITVTGINPGDFTESGSCGTSLASGASCTVSVVFSPAVLGARSAALSIAYAGGGSPQLVSLTGTGASTTISLTPARITFPVTLVGQISPARHVTLTNTGSGTLSISSVVPSMPFIAHSNCGATLAAGASCTIIVGFRPVNRDTFVGQVTVTDDGVNSPQMVTLVGIGTVLTITPSSLTFPPTAVGHTSAAETVTVTDLSPGPVHFTSISITGADASDFAQTNTCGATLGGGTSCTVSVTFTPSATGTRTATLSLVDDGGGSPQTITLQGTGT